MERIISRTYMALLLGSLAAAQGTLLVEDKPHGDDSTVPFAGADAHALGQLLVRFASPDMALDICSQSAGRWELSEVLFQDLNLYLVRFAEALPVMGERDRLNGTPGVLYAMENGRMNLRQTLPNDPLFAQQATHDNTGQTGGSVDADMDAPEAWDIARGSDEFVVAIVDAGGNTDHEDLLANRWENMLEINGAAGVDDDSNGYVDDFYGWNTYGNNGQILTSNHGTRVAGIVGARGNNGLGGTGVLWETDLMYVNMVPFGLQFFYSDLARAYDYVIQQKRLWRLTSGQVGTPNLGANVVAINASWGLSGFSCQTHPYYLWNDLFNQAGALGILTVGSTDPGPTDVDQAGDIPSGCLSESLIAVTMTDRFDVLSGAFGAQMIDLAAPGTGIVAPRNTTDYDVTSATSWAAPIVTGAVALMHDAASPAFKDFYIVEPQAASQVIKTLLIETVDPLPSLAGITVSGGRLNLRRALQAIASYGPLGSPYCQATTPNSAGNLATLSGEGNLYVSENTLQLVAQGLPHNQFGYFLVGSSQGSTAISGSQGLLCVSGQFGRFNRPGQIGFSGSAGTLTLAVDLGNLPTFPASAVQPGETWNFQAWYRDQNPGATSNFSEALGIMFQ